MLSLSSQGGCDARTRTYRSAPGGADRLRRLPARADSDGFRTQGRDAPGARCLGADDRGRAGGGRTGDLHDACQPLRWRRRRAAADRPFGGDRRAAAHQWYRGLAGGRLPRRDRAATRGLRLSQAPAERLLWDRRRRAAAHAAAQHDHYRRRRHQSRRRDQRARGLQPRPRVCRGARMLLERRPGRPRLQPRQCTRAFEASTRSRRCCGNEGREFGASQQNPPGEPIREWWFATQISYLWTWAQVCRIPPKGMAR